MNKSILLTGRGKTTMVNFLTQHVEKEDVHHTSLGDMVTNPFGPGVAIEKKIIIIEIDDPADEKHFSSDRLKAILSGDKVHSERRFKEPELRAFDNHSFIFICQDGVYEELDLTAGMKRRINCFNLTII